MIMALGAEARNCKSGLLAASATTKSVCAAARTRPFRHSPGRPPQMAVRAAASANMTSRKRVRKRRDEFARANLCDLRDWRREAVWLSLIITPQVFQNRLRRREAAMRRGAICVIDNGVFIRSPWGFGENRT